jgi:hypothetical protein
MTVDELGKKIKSGEMLPSQSPVFAATLHHIYGENNMGHLERDTLSKLQTGQLKFNTQEEVDQYLTEARNDVLQGQNKFTIAGFERASTSSRPPSLRPTQGSPTSSSCSVVFRRVRITSIWSSLK